MMFPKQTYTLPPSLTNADTFGINHGCENCKRLQIIIDELEDARVSKFTIPKSWIKEDMEIE